MNKLISEEKNSSRAASLGLGRICAARGAAEPHCAGFWDGLQPRPWTQPCGWAGLPLEAYLGLAQLHEAVRGFISPRGRRLPPADAKDGGSAPAATGDRRHGEELPMAETEAALRTAPGATSREVGGGPGRAGQRGGSSWPRSAMPRLAPAMGSPGAPTVVGDGRSYSYHTRGHRQG
jgi:hypothetical protein